jgi:hypothetical protein
MRFHTENRFSRVSFAQLHRLMEVIEAELCNPFTYIQVLTCEDRNTTYNYSTVTFADDRVTETLKKRKTYSWEDFSREVWQRSSRVEVILKKHFKPDFSICLSVDRLNDSKSIFFYGYSVEESLEAKIRKMYARTKHHS